MTAVRRVQLPAGVQFHDYTEFQVNYLNYRTGWLIPGTEIWIGGSLAVQINSLACKGPELLAGVPVIGVFGDSTTFGVGLDSWPAHVSIPGHQPLNCSVEGHELTRVAERYRQIREQVDLAATVVGGSWHNLVYNEHTRDFWKARFDSFGDREPVAICTLATSLVPECCERGLDDAIARTYVGGNRFVAWGTWPTDAQRTRELYDGVLRYNDFVRAYCEDTGRILIDLYDVSRPGSYNEMGQMFMDPAHQRQALYPALGRAASDALFPELRGGDMAAPRLTHAESMPVPLGAADDDALHRNIYPLW